MAKKKDEVPEDVNKELESDWVIDFGFPNFGDSNSLLTSSGTSSFFLAIYHQKLFVFVFFAFLPPI